MLCVLHPVRTRGETEAPTSQATSGLELQTPSQLPLQNSNDGNTGIFPPSSAFLGQG